MASPPKKKPLMVYTFPNFVFVEFVVALGVTLFFTIWSMFINAPLEELANPNASPNPAKAPWYFLGLQELLVYFDPWIAGVVLPGLILGGLAVLPYIDKNPKGVGYFTIKDRPYAFWFFTYGMFIWTIMIVIGTWLRGPSWAWFWPGESWEIHKPVGGLLWSFNGEPWPDQMVRAGYWLTQILPAQPPMWLGWLAFLGISGALAVVPTWIDGAKVPFIGQRERYLRWGVVRWYVVQTFVVLTHWCLIKLVMRLAFDIKYIVVTPWFNI